MALRFPVQRPSLLLVAMPTDVSNAASGTYPGRPLPAGSRVLDQTTLTNNPDVGEESCDDVDS
jgi:hypothetical protein